MRKFGIELELIAPNGQDPYNFSRSTLESVNVSVHTQRSHVGGDYTRWTCKHDGSIQPFARGIEVVSRIMPADESSYAEVTRAVSALETAGFGVNRTCGFHVHVSIADLPVHIRQLVILRYAHLQPEIDSFLPPSRRDGANSFCPALGTQRARELAGYIDAGSHDYPSMGRYSVTNMAWISERQGSNARIEYRQAGGTCDAAKVIGWVRFLQEMIDGVVAKAAGVRFGGRATARPTMPNPVTRPVTPLSRVPRMRVGSDNERACTQLRTQGAISAAWAAENGIAEPTLRRMIVGFRRHGAAIATVRTSAGVVYTLAGQHALPVSLIAMFAPPTVATAPAPVVAPAAPFTAAPATMQAMAFIAYPFNDGLSADTVAWVRTRRDTFNADRAA